MKDRTHSMNMESGGGGAVNGYTDPGIPTSSHEDKRKKLAQGALLDTTLGQVENLDPSGFSRGGFLKRNNFSDRF